MSNFYGAIALTGGGTGALDKIDGAGLSDLDGAFVVVNGILYPYFLDVDSGEAENVPFVIAPDSNPGDKRWVLSGVGSSDIFTNGPEIDVRLYGTYTVDIGNSVNLAHAALPATGGRIILPASATAFPQTTTISITKPCEIIGMGRGASIIEKQADIVGITINTSTGRVLLEDFTLDSDGSDSGKNGITITEFRRGVISRVEVRDQSNHGIEFLKGNLSAFRDLQLISNGGDGLKVNASDVNCNACIFSNIDASSNTGWGFNIEDGNENWCIGITCQSNGNGIRVNGYGNVLYVYAENNTGEDVELTAAAKANIVHSIIPNAVTTGNTANTVYSRAGGADAVFGEEARFINGFYIGRDGAKQGKLTIYDGAGGNTPGYIKIYSPNGTAWYLFVEDDGTVKVHNAVPTQNSDGSEVGGQS